MTPPWGDPRKTIRCVMCGATISERLQSAHRTVCPGLRDKKKGRR